MAKTKITRIPGHPWEIPRGSRLTVKKAQTIRVWRCADCHRIYDYQPIGEKLHSNYCECGGRLSLARVRDI